MQSRVDNLWPTDIEARSGQLSPVAILKQQAALLGERTKNLVEAEVETKATDYQRQLQHWFYLVAPALDFYKYPLFRVEHPAIRFYPLRIVLAKVRPKTATEVKKRPSLAERVIAQGFDAFEGISAREQAMMLKVKSEDAFKAHLKTIFAATETKSIIQSLIDQSV